MDHSCGLSRDSIVLLEQVRTLDKKRLRERMGHVEEAVMEKVDFGHRGELRPAPRSDGVRDPFLRQSYTGRSDCGGSRLLAAR